MNKIQKKYYVSSILLFSYLFISFSYLNCSKDNPVDNSIDIRGEFIVDTFDVQVIKKLNSSTNIIENYASFFFKYHFESLPGSIDYTRLEVKNYRNIGINSDPVYPSEIEKLYQISIDLPLKNDLVNVDSISVSCLLKGTFWKKDDNSNKFLGTFEWSKEQKVAVIK